MKDIKNIFVIDDDAITLFGIKKMLSKITSSSTIFEFKNGQLSIDNILMRLHNGTDLPEVIFLDINMPVLDGWGFLKEFISLDIKQRILINIVTSSIDPHDREQWLYFKGKTHHFIDFINKPVYKIELKDLHKMEIAS